MKGFQGVPCNATLDVVFWVINSVIAVLMLAGNSLSCAVFLKTRHLRRSFMNIYLVSLAISDISMGLFVVPFYSVFCSGCKYSLTKYCWAIRFLKGFAFGANIFNLLAISLDRHEAFINPLRYTSKMTRKKLVFILAMVWGAPVLLAGTRNFWQHSSSREKALFIDKTYSIILTFIFVIIPFFLLLGINFKILIVIKKQVQRIHVANAVQNFPSNLSTKRSRAVNNVRKLKGTLACVVVVLIYVLCWLPRIFYNFCFLFRRKDLVSPLLIHLSLFFLFLQSSLNPFIYSFYRVEFRQAASRLLRCRPYSTVEIITSSRNAHTID